jgi:protease prsW family protein
MSRRETGCQRCGGSHTSRQRCPLDPNPAEWTPTPIPPTLQGMPVPSAGPLRTAARQPAFQDARTTYRTAQRWPSRHVGGAGNAAVQWISAVFCTTLLIVCLSVAGVYIARLPEVAHDVADTLIVIFISAGAGTLFGAVPLYYTARAYSGLAYAALSTALITGGVIMLAAAPVVRQMNVPHVAEYQGFYALLWFGLASTALGLVLAAICVRWSLARDARRRLARWGRLLSTAYGVLLGLSGIVMTLSLFALLDADPNDEFGFEPSVVEQALLLTAVALFSLVPGIILTYHGISESMGEGSAEAMAPVAALMAAGFVIVLILGQLNMRTESPIALLMPPLHAAAAALPGLTFVALAGRGSPFRGAPVRGLTWRQLTLAAGLSMSVATSIALYVEGLGSVVAILLLLVHNGAFEFAANSGEVFDILDAADFLLTENEQFAAGLIIAAVLAPVSEEFGKSLSVRFLMRATSTRAQCFLLGAAAGAAFGFLEAMLYGVSGIEEDLADWWQIMLIRGGSSSLHVICSGLAGIGWWYWSVARRHRPALALFAGAVLIHAGWNAFATVLDSRIFVLDTLSNHTLEVLAYSIVAVISTAMIVAIPLVARRLRDAPPAPIGDTALAGMQAWLG